MVLVHGSFRNVGVPHFGVLIIRILLFRVLYLGPLFSETPTYSDPPKYTLNILSPYPDPRVSKAVASKGVVFFKFRHRGIL